MELLDGLLVVCGDLLSFDIKPEFGFSVMFQHVAFIIYLYFII